MNEYEDATEPLREAIAELRARLSAVEQEYERLLDWCRKPVREAYELARAAETRAEAAEGQIRVGRDFVRDAIHALAIDAGKVRRVDTALEWLKRADTVLSRAALAGREETGGDGEG